MQSRDSKILSDAIAVAALTVMVKLAGAAKVVVSAHLFGASDPFDAFLIAFVIPSFLAEVLAGSLTASVIPTFIDVRENQGEHAAHELYSTILVGAALLLCAAALIAAAGSGPLIQILGSGFTPEKARLTQKLFLVMAPVIPLSGVSIIWRSLLNANERFAAAAVVPIMTPLISILLLWSAGRALGAFALALGALAGTSAEVLFLALVLRSHAMRIAPVRPRWAPAVRQVMYQYTPMAAGSIMLSGSNLIDQTMAAMLPAGSVSALNFGTRVTGVILAIGPSALSTALLPRFSRMSATSDWAGLRGSLRRYALLSMLASIPATALLIYLSPVIVKIIFQRGAFSAADASIVARIQAFSLLQVPFSMLLALVVRCVSSLKMNELLLRMAAAGTVANVALDYTLMQYFGVAGIALATPFVALISLALLSFLLLRRVKMRPVAAY